jgi:peptide/nickel transport system substrate-binding protein
MAFQRIAKLVALGFILILAVSLGQVASAQTTLRVVLHSDLKIVDPIWTTAYISRNYGYMVYDTLFAMDEKMEVKPQMVDTYSVSNDKLTYTFTLRDGLFWHDGPPVKAEDCVASIKRWGQRDSMGQKLMQFTKDLKVVGAKTFQLILKEPYGLVLQSLGKPSSTVPFMMPKRIAETPANKQISEYVGSGPFIFKADEWKPGDKAVFVKNPKYKPRSEPPSWASGGKVVKVDRVEWVWIPDHQTAINALIAGEIDYIEAPPHDLLPILEAEKDKIGLTNINPLGNQYMFRMNWLHPPFNNVKLRQAALASLQQEDFLKAVIGNPKYYKACQAMFICGTPFASDAGAPVTMKADLKRARKLLKEGGYDGTPVVVMQSTDVAVLNNLAPVAANALKQAGFKVDLQAMDWQTLVARRAKKEPPSQGGWNVFLTSWVAADVLNPIMAAGFAASCDKAWFGWPCDKKMEQLRDAFARETDLQKQKKLAEQVQVRALEIGTHAHCGQWYQPVAYRKNHIAGLLNGPVPFFWNITKK